MIQEPPEITILGKPVPLEIHDMSIDELRFFIDNPRVYDCTHGDPSFDEKIDEEKQDFIYNKLLEEQSVKKLLKDIEFQGGLLENIIVRWETKEVIEGNSRLAVFRKFHAEKKPGNWDQIPCSVAFNLTDDQIVSFLNQIHVKGKTEWSPYQKANFVYVQYTRGWSIERIADLCREKEKEISKRIATIEMMKEHDDDNMTHFSYYDVLIRSKFISQEINNNAELKKVILAQIKQVGSGQDPEFNALALRNKLPAIIKKRKILKKFVGQNIDLNSAYEYAKISGAEKNIERAREIVKLITRKEIDSLDRSQFNALKQKVKKLKQEVDRLKNIMENFTRDS